jgi:hypothetical protein
LKNIFVNSEAQQNLERRAEGHFREGRRVLRKVHQRVFLLRTSLAETPRVPPPTFTVTTREQFSAEWRAIARFSEG